MITIARIHKYGIHSFRKKKKDIWKAEYVVDDLFGLFIDILHSNHSMRYQLLKVAFKASIIWTDKSSMPVVPKN